MTAESRERCERVLRLLDDARDRPVEELSREVGDAERLLVAVRDDLIARLRREPTEPRTALDHVNAALSLVVGVEYPGARIQRKSLDQAMRAVRAALDQTTVG